ncbi:uncharacterized protein METZ01_LOCUS491476, partial [marine metagenome]
MITRSTGQASAIDDWISSDARENRLENRLAIGVGEGLGRIFQGIDRGQGLEIHLARLQELDG